MENKPSILTEFDIYLFKEGNHYKIYDKLGAHIVENGVFFAVWAPDAVYVSVIGDFNNWDSSKNPLKPHEDGSGIWDGIVKNAKKGSLYKYFIKSRYNNYTVLKSDPIGFFFETPPKTASIVWELDYEWEDKEWMKKRKEKNNLNAPISIYEVHLGSWKRKGFHFLNYREIADELVKYVKEMGFTHIQFLPIMEHPFYGSWGYQITGYFAPTSRYGTPQDFMYLVDKFHQSDIGIILDWVPSHFPNDEHGLSFFDGTHLYEHQDRRKGYHPDWNSLIFNYGRNEVREFLISSALFWFEKYHIDAIRVDAVASMLYLDYSRNEGEWVPNKFGGRENLEAIDFIKRLNVEIYGKHNDTQTIAEESTAWPAVTKPVYLNGLGFGMKWKMGWMNDTLRYFSKEPVHRKYHQDLITFSIWYAFTENYILPLSHDEVVHGKGSLLSKMPGDLWQKFANLRCLYGYMFSHPGKKLLFMGGEIGVWNEWNHEKEIEWSLLNFDMHIKLKNYVRDLNWLYRKEKALYELDFSYEGFEWIDFSDADSSVVSYIRKSTDGEKILIICNFTPVPRHSYRIGVPERGFWKEIFNSDAIEYGGSGEGNLGGKHTEDIPSHGRKYSLSLTFPPLGVVYLKYEG